ncbi:MAG: SnoK protein [Candidatus Poribacteria bacterium]|nr:MAG: SnoK protein [Candidatus Poribacteria bacterium]
MVRFGGEYPLTRDQIQFYRENGFVQLDNVLTAEELEFLRNALEEAVMAPARHAVVNSDGRSDYAKVFYQKVNIWRDHEGVREFVFSPRLAEIARRLAGFRAVRLWHDHALIKMPGPDSRPSPWHQDLPYWPMNEEGALSCWMALDDVTVHNGCMQFIPGTHRLGKLPPINLVQPQDIFSMIPPEKKHLIGKEPYVAEMKAGSCTFHDGRTFHYASPNRSDKPRRAMVVIYMADGTTYNGKRHICTDPLGLQVGDRLEGELFPLLAEGEPE